MSPDGQRNMQFDERQKTTAELLKSLAEAHEQQSGSWGAVVNPLNLSNLKKTATAFLSQVEKSLAPLPMNVETAGIPVLTPTPSKSKKQY